jgi:hypothetical protein
MIVRNNMTKYHLVEANCQTFVLDTICCIKSHSVPNTKHRTLASCVKRACDYVQFTPLRTFRMIAHMVTVMLVFIASLVYYYESGDARNNVMKALVMPMALLAMMKIFTIPDLSDDQTPIRNRVQRDRFLTAQLYKLGFAILQTRTLLIILNTTVPDLPFLTIATFEVTITFLGCHMAWFMVLLMVGDDSYGYTEAQALAPHDKNHRDEHISGDSGDKSESHDSLRMRSRYTSAPTNSPDTTPEPIEHILLRLRAVCDSIVKAQGKPTLSSGNDHVDISQYEQPKKNQEQLHDAGNDHADAMEVAAEVGQPLSEQVPLLVRRRPRQRHRIIVLDVDEDTTAVE